MSMVDTTNNMAADYIIARFENVNKVVNVFAYTYCAFTKNYSFVKSWKFFLLIFFYK